MKKITGLALILTILIIIGCSEIEDGQMLMDENPKNGTETKGTETMELVENFSIEEVAIHDNESDCWMVIDGNVYNVTNYINTHPGGASILEGCGKDATELFETRPMGSGTSHSQKSRNLLEIYKIGELSE